MLPPIQLIIGKKCWSCIAGRGTGSMVLIKFGEKIPRIRPVNNPYLSADDQQYEGEYSIRIEGAAWRLRSPNSIICGWRDSNSNGGPMVLGLKQLTGEIVTSANIEDGSFDINLTFSCGLRLQIFCDETNQQASGANYVFRVGGESWQVGGGGKILYTKR